MKLRPISQNYSPTCWTARDDQREWLALWQRMEEHPQTFSPFYRALTRLGWETHSVDETMRFLADLLTEDWQLSPEMLLLQRSPR